MKVLKVNRNCDGCGLCIVNCIYLQENKEGNAEFAEGKYIEEGDYEDVVKVVEECPCNALQIVEEGSTKKKGAEGVQEVINNLKKQLENLKVVRKDDLKFDVRNYYFSVPSSSKEYVEKYKSESEARAAARNEFNRLCYSENAYRPILKKVFVEYKVRVLKPYYDCNDEEGNIYFEYNQRIRKMLAKAYAEINCLFADEIPEEWKEFSVYFSNEDWEILSLTKFDERSTSFGIMTALKDLSYSSLDHYVSAIDFEYNEMYVGESLFGHSKFKNEWYFSNFYEAAHRFIDDLKWAIGHQSFDIQEEAINLVDYAMENFEKKLKEELKEKISELERITSAMKDTKAKVTRAIANQKKTLVFEAKIYKNGSLIALGARVALNEEKIRIEMDHEEDVIEDTNLRATVKWCTDGLMYWGYHIICSNQSDVKKIHDFFDKLYYGIGI